MPVLSNNRHELFAQGLAIGKSATQAYIDAGYSENGAQQAASKLLLIAVIQGRLSELQERAAIKAEYTVQDILLEYEVARQIAKQNNQPSAMIAATTGKAKLLGLFADKCELSGGLAISKIERVIIDPEDMARIAELVREVDNEY